MSCPKVSWFILSKRLQLHCLFDLEQYEELTKDVELALDEADRAADLSVIRYFDDEVFSRVRRCIRDRKAL